MLFSKPGLTLTKVMASVAICVSSTAGVAATGRAAVRPSASVPALALSSTVMTAAIANPCVAGVQGCVLPVGQTPPPVVVNTTPVYVADTAVASGGLGVLPIIAGLALLGGLAYLLLDNDDDEEPEPEPEPPVSP